MQSDAEMCCGQRHNACGHHARQHPHLVDLIKMHKTDGFGETRLVSHAPSSSRAGKQNYCYCYYPHLNFLSCVLAFCSSLCSSWRLWSRHFSKASDGRLPKSLILRSSSVRLPCNALRLLISVSKAFCSSCQTTCTKSQADALDTVAQIGVKLMAAFACSLLISIFRGFMPSCMHG